MCLFHGMYLPEAACPLPSLSPPPPLPLPLLWDDQEPLSKAVGFSIHALCGYWTTGLSAHLLDKQLGLLREGGAPRISLQQQQHHLRALPSLCRTVS